MNDFKFSVLMSLYFRENPEYLSEAIDSVITNTIPPDEIVIVFDGPLNDDLENVVASFLERVKVIIVRLDENKGLGVALNHGLVACNNEWVFRMDTDDICTINRFEKQIEMILERPYLDIVGGYIEEFSEDLTKSMGIRKVPMMHDEILRGVKSRSPFNHMTVAFKKSTIVKIGSYQHHFCMEDYNLWVRLLSGGANACNLGIVLVKVRAGDSMLNRRRGVRYFSSEIKLARLKHQKNVQSFCSATTTFLMRSLPRMLPVSVLKIVYKVLRSR